MDSGSTYTAIGSLAQRTGANVETIRYYERVGLLPAPARSAGGYRLYGIAHVKRLMFIRRARALGFSIDEVRTLLKLADERKRPLPGSAELRSWNRCGSILRHSTTAIAQGALCSEGAGDISDVRPTRILRA